MRAQLRTYHAIPSLQAHQDPNSYKQLQDAPRLKSILKGASEDRDEPTTLEALKELPTPRTNPVNMIFVLAQFASKVTELHFPAQRDFYDLIMRASLSSRSRATAFLWLMWHYLESDFTEEAAAENPFGPGVDYGKGVRNQGVPEFELLTPEREHLENTDPQEEIDYGLAKMQERKRIIEADIAAAENGPPKRGPKPKLQFPGEEGFSPAPSSVSRVRPSKYESDIDSTRSTPPPRGMGAPGMRINSVISTASRRNGSSIKHQIVDGSSPAGGFAGTMTAESGSRRSRPLTAHQIAVEHNRSERVNYILSRGLRKKHHLARKLRRQEGALLRALARTKAMQDPFCDSEDEESIQKPTRPFRERGLGGLVQLEEEDDDFGEEMAAYAAALRRTGRRLGRWEGHIGGSLGVVGTNRVVQPPRAHETNGNEGQGDETEEDIEDTVPQARKSPKDDVIMEDRGEEDDLDDIDRELIGVGSGDDAEAEVGPDGGGYEVLDDEEKELLGIRGDETEEEDISERGMDVD